MKSATRSAIRTLISSDPTLDRDTRAALLVAMDAPHPAKAAADPAPRLIHRPEAARRLGCSTRTLDALARAGALRRVRWPGRVRGAGFIESDIAALIEGRAAAGRGAA